MNATVFVANSATVSGKIENSLGDVLPFASLYIEETARGTTSNIEGNYSIQLESGHYHLIFQYVGYKKKTVKLTVGDQNIILDIALEPETLTLDEVVVTSTFEEPSYAVIRAAIGNRQKHLKEVYAYQCQVYIKGLQTIDQQPATTFGLTVPIDTGIVYLSESISQLSVEQPNKTKEVMVSSKVSGQGTAFSYNQASQTLVSFYENIIKIEGLTERGFISPIANNAFLYYDYQLEGKFYDKDRLVYKIKVSPLRPSDPVFEGFIYIMDESWRIHSLDLTITRAHQLEIMDRLNIHQIFAPVANQYWMILSQRFNARLNLFGFKGSGYFVGVFSDYKLELNSEYFRMDSVDQNHHAIVHDLFQDGYFDNEVLKIEEGSNQRSAEYWQTHRPIPLTALERKDYERKEQLNTLMTSRAYLDTLDKRMNRPKLGKIMVKGYAIRRSYKERIYQFAPLHEVIQYNTVEGAVGELQMRFTQYNYEIPKYSITPQLRYGEASKTGYARLKTKLFFDPKKFSELTVEGGRFVRQYNPDNPILPIVNTLETLINRRNYLKIYESSYLNLQAERELINGIHGWFGLNYSRRSQLVNHDSVSIFYTDRQHRLTPNTPLNAELENTSFQPHEAFIFSSRILFSFRQGFIMRPDRKFLVPSKYPQIQLHYQKGILAFGSKLDFDKVHVQVKDDFSLGMLGNSNYMIAAGQFLRKDSLTFIDFEHFNTTRSSYSNFEVSYFNVLDYYEFSTSGRWLEAHYVHHFDGFIMNKIPLLKQTKMQMISGFHFLHTPDAQAYMEYGLGLEHIAKVGRFAFYTAMLDGKHYTSGFRFGIGL